jgi:hypothetical protein
MKITDNNKQLINWDKQQLLISDTNGTIVLSTTEHDDVYFRGVSIQIVQEKVEITSWKKSLFKVFNGTISND